MALVATTSGQLTHQFTMLSYPGSSFDATLHVLVLLALAALCFYIAKLAAQFYRNYRNARQTGLPILFTPLDPFGLPWILLFINFGHLLARFRWCRLLGMTWGWQDNDKWHRLLGNSFVLVGPTKCTIHTNDPVAIDWVLGKRKEFPKPWVYGESCEGKRW